MFSAKKESKKNLRLYDEISLEKTKWETLHEIYKEKLKNNAVFHSLPDIENEIRQRKNGLEKLDGILEKYIDKNGNKAPSEYQTLNLLYYFSNFKTNQPYADKARKITQPTIIKYKAGTPITYGMIITSAIKELRLIYDEMESMRISDNSEIKSALKNFLNDYCIPLKKEDYDYLIKNNRI